jgi:phytanoyl-CoA hydroxylase
MIATPEPRELYLYARTATVLPSLEALDETSEAAYLQDGFLAVANVLNPEEVATAKAALADLIHGRVPDYHDLQPEPEHKDRWDSMTAEERADTVRKVWLFVKHEPRLMALTCHPTIQAILGRLLGEPCHLIQDMALLKPPFIGSEKPWHQDMAYFGWAPPEKIIGVWIALDPATPENGCMHVLPGTHREGPVPHVHARDCQIADDRVEVDRDVMVPLAPGGALFFSSLLHHGTPPNQSPNRRWALQYHYAAASAERIDRLAHAALYFNGDRYAGCRGGSGTPIDEMKGE